MTAKWEGDDLYYLLPIGEWQRLASFRDGQFEEQWEPVRIGEKTWPGVLWKFERVSAAEASASDLFRRFHRQVGRWDYRKGREGKVCE